MNCKQARRLIHELLDGADFDRTQLDHHLAQCPACRAELQALQQIQAGVADAVQCQVSEELLDRATARVLPTLAAGQRPTAPAARIVRAMAAAGLVLLVFGLGLSGGRWAWPREVTVTQVVKVPEVREKIVKVEVPVVKERVVVKRVLVYKTKIVYREVEKPSPVAETDNEPAPIEPEQFVMAPESEPIMTATMIFQETRPARLASEVEPEEAPATQGHWEPPDTTISAQTVLAQKPPNQ